MFKVGIITASDKGYTGEREDLSGKAIKEIVESKGYKVERAIILPDDEELLLKEIIYMADEQKVDLILTTGGTGFNKKDVTPEATMKACHRMANGIAEAIRYYSLSITPRAMLSRAVSGIRGRNPYYKSPWKPKSC